MIAFNEFSEAIIGMLNRNYETDFSALTTNFSAPTTNALDNSTKPIAEQPPKLETAISENLRTVKTETVAETKPANVEPPSAANENETTNGNYAPFKYTPSQDTLRYLYSFMWNNDFLEDFWPDTDYMQPVTEMVREELKTNAGFAASFREVEEKLRQEQFEAQNETSRKRLEFKENMERELRLKRAAAARLKTL